MHARSPPTMIRTSSRLTAAGPHNSLIPRGRVTKLNKLVLAVPVRIMAELVGDMMSSELTVRRYRKIDRRGVVDWSARRFS